jgi:hypothetical protein
MRWVRIRKAKSVPKGDREIFERVGASIIGIILYGDFSGQQMTEVQKTRKHAEAWLTEQYDCAERKETWSITMEAAITLFVAVELVFSILNFVCRKG